MLFLRCLFIGYIHLCDFIHYKSLKRVDPDLDEKILTSGYHKYQLKGLNLRYIYFSQKHFSE